MNSGWQYTPPPARQQEISQIGRFFVIHTPTTSFSNASACAPHESNSDKVPGSSRSMESNLISTESPHRPKPKALTRPLPEG